MKRTHDKTTRDLKFPRTAMLRLVLAGATGLGLTLVSAFSSDRVALVIANSTYQESGSIPILQNALSDATLVSVALKKAGYAVTSLHDLTAGELHKAVQEFAKTIPRDAESTFFFAGHGFEVEKESYLLGIEARVAEGSISLDAAVKIESIIEEIARRQPRVSLYFLDCCRELLSVSASSKRGIRSVLGPTSENYPEMLISYSSEPGGIALDGQELGLPNSPYSQSLATAISEGLELSNLMTKVRREVFRITGGRQRTWDSSSLVEDYFFSERGFSLVSASVTNANDEESPNESAKVQPKSAGEDWDIHQYRGKEYVDVQNISKFYEFERIVSADGAVSLLHPSIGLTLVKNSSEVYMNGILFYSSFPMPVSGDTLLVSTVDLAKLLDPVLRPSYIRRPEGPESAPQFLLLFDKTPLTADPKFFQNLTSRLEQSEVPATIFISDSEKERSEWLTANSEIPGAHVVYFRFEVAGIPPSGMRAMTVTPQGSPPTGEPETQALSLPVISNKFDAENIALATAYYAHLSVGLQEFDPQLLGLGRTQKPEMRAISCPAALVEFGRPRAALQNEPERFVTAIAEAAVGYKRAIGKRGSALQDAPKQP